MSNETRTKHPAFGTIRLSHVSGWGRHLFGSQLAHHDEVVTLRIEQAVLVQEDGVRDEIFSTGPALIEITLSPSQFASMLTNMNHKAIPCTIRSLNGALIEEPPFSAQGERLVSDFEKKVRAMTSNGVAARDEALEILTKKKLDKADQARLKDLIGSVFAVTRDASFYLSEFQAAAQSMADAAKAEVDAFVTGVLVRTGIAVLKEKREDTLEEKAERVKGAKVLLESHRRHADAKLEKMLG